MKIPKGYKFHTRALTA